MQTPSLIFRYRPITLYTLEELSEGMIWFSSVDGFNDPFEFRFRTRLIDSVLSLHSLSIPLIESNIKTLSEKSNNPNVNEVNRLIVDGSREILKELDSAKNLAREMAISIASFSKSIGISCFSSCADSNLMWGHYTNGHRGIVIGYDTTSLPFSEAAPVNYSHDIPYADSLSSLEILQKICYTKSPHWSYESEYRIVSTDYNCRKFIHARDAIRTICFGALCSKEHQTMIRRLVGAIDVKFSQAQLSEVDYSISIEPL